MNKHEDEKFSSATSESLIMDKVYRRIQPHKGKLEDMQAQLYEFILRRSKEKRAAVELSEIQAHFTIWSTLVIFQAIVDLYEAGKLHEIRMHQYLPREF